MNHSTWETVNARLQRTYRSQWSEDDAQELLRS